MRDDLSPALCATAAAVAAAGAGPCAAPDHRAADPLADRQPGSAPAACAPLDQSRRGGSAWRARLQAGAMGLATAGLLAASAAWSPPAAAQASPVLDRVRAQNNLRVCIWPDYYGITWRSPRTQQLGGLDIELSAAFAKDLGVALTYVNSSFATLIDDLLQERCDISMHAVAVLPARAERLRFSQPYLRSDVYGITTRSNRQVRTWEDIDKPGVRVAVQAGTFMEPVMNGALKQAQLVVVRPPQTREQELEAGRVDVFMTDYPYSRRLLDNADWARLISPSQAFHVLPYAYAVKPGDEAWLKRVDEFVAAIKRDGRLQAAATRHGLAEIVVPR